MRKSLVFILAVILAAGLLAGCGGSGQQPAKPLQLILATGGTGGTYHPYGQAMAKVISSKIPTINISVQTTGASIENLRLVNKKEAELGIVQNDTLDYAYNGREMFKDKLPNIRGIAVLYPEIIQIVVRAESGINAFSDLKGRKFGVGPPGSGTEANFRQLLEVHGFDYKAMSPAYISFADGADQFRDKLVDGFIVTAGIPNPAIADIAAAVKILPLSDDIIDKLTHKYPFFTPYTIPANTYKGQTMPVKTLAVQAALVVNSEVSADVVYNITKTLFENQAELAQAHAKGQELSLAAAIKGLSVPFHPGAEKYYREKGVIK